MGRCSQEASKGEWARTRILDMSRQMMKECRASKDLDKRSIAVRAVRLVKPSGHAWCALA